MTLRDRMTLTAALAVLLAATALVPVFEGAGWVLRTLLAVVVVAGTGALCRRAGLPALVTVLVQAAALVVLVVVAFAGASLHHLVLPGSATVTTLRDLFTAMGADLEQYATPAPPTDALVLLVVLGVGGVALVVDALAVAARRAALAGLPLLGLFAVPSALVPGGVAWWAFVCAAAGWLALLLVEGSDRVSRWAPSPADAPPGDPAGLSRVGRRIGGAALGVAVLVPALLPGLDGRLFEGNGLGDGGGSGGGSRNVATYNPITRLQGQLTLPDPIDVLRYTTNDIDPDYLRMTTLGVYDGRGWQQEPLTGNPRRNGVDRGIPLPAGRGAVPVREVEAQITIEDLDAFWLPVPATPSSVRVNGPWMWDAGSESVFATRTTTRKLSPYVVRSSRVLPDPALLTASSGAVPPEVQPYDTPIEATTEVRALTGRVVNGQTTDYGRAAAIQAFFRDPANDFEYAEDTRTGSSPDALQSFLEQRVGYCEQYASAMAAMLRIAGVPSRVAVGFTPGKRLDDNSFLVTTDEAHAWPEAWFQDTGWVRFEPTPTQGGIRAPAYAQPPAAEGTDSEVLSPTTTTDPSLGEDVDGETPLERKDRLDAEASQRNGVAPVVDPEQDAGPPVGRLLAGGGVLLLLAAPALLHAGRRRRRWRSPDATTAWAQLRDDATDAGHAWDDAETPRAAVTRLVRQQTLDPGPAAAAGRVASAVERARYARPGTDHDDSALAADVAAVRHALHSGLPLGARLRVALLPPSTLRWGSHVLGSRTADLLDGLDRLLSSASGAVRSRLRRRAA